MSKNTKIDTNCIHPYVRGWHAGSEAKGFHPDCVNRDQDLIEFRQALSRVAYERGFKDGLQDTIAMERRANRLFPIEGGEAQPK